MNILEKIKVGYDAARTAERKTPIENLPFTPVGKEEFLSKFESLKKGMQIEPISREEGYLIALTETSWADSPESNLATLQAEQHFLSLFNESRKIGNAKSWETLKPIYHKYAAKKAQELWKRDRNSALSYIKDSEKPSTPYSPSIHSIAKKIDENIENIDQAMTNLRKKKPNISDENLRIEAIDQVIGVGYQARKINNIKATKAFHHGKRLTRRDHIISETHDKDLQMRLLKETIKENELRNNALLSEAKKSKWSIGRPNRDFFDMGMFRINKLNLDTGKVETSYPAGLLIQDPKHANEKKPDGVGILPWYVGDIEYSSNNVYVRIGLRNEPGAPNHVTAIAAEQTSIAKIENGDILNQAGKDIIAICVREELAINCEKLPTFTEAIPQVANVVLANRDTNRMGIKPNAYASIKVEHGSKLMESYEEDKNSFWISLKDLEQVMEETKEHQAIVNELLLAAKGQLDKHLRHKAESNVEKLNQILKDISHNPVTHFGWVIGFWVNLLEKKLGQHSQ